MMTDKEVGQLWAKHKLPVVEQLIRKLVYERAWRLHVGVIDLALLQFGIDPETWK